MQVHFNSSIVFWIIKQCIFFLLHLAFIAEGGGEIRLEAEMELTFISAIGFKKILQPSNFLGMKNTTSLLIIFPLFVYYLRLL